MSSPFFSQPQPLASTSAAGLPQQQQQQQQLRGPHPLLKIPGFGHKNVASLVRDKDAGAGQAQPGLPAHKHTGPLGPPDCAQKKRGSATSVFMNKQIMASRNTYELLSLVRARGKEFDFFNISSAVARVPKLTGFDSTASEHHLDLTAKALADDLASLMAEHIHEFDARGLANSAWCVLARFSPCGIEYMASLLDVVVHGSPACTPGTVLG